MAAAIHFDDVTLGYGRDAVLEGLSFQVDAGSLVAVVGASGAGKSTILRAAAGLLDPIRGKIQRPAGSMAWVPQADSVHLGHPLSVMEVVTGGRRIARRELPSTRSRVDGLLDELDLPTGSASARFSRLSGGQRQRVLVARALFSDHRMILLDEPTSALDKASALLVRDAIERRVNAGATAFYATHKHEEIHDVAGLCLELEGGRAHLHGSHAWT